MNVSITEITISHEIMSKEDTLQTILLLACANYLEIKELTLGKDSFDSLELELRRKVAYKDGGTLDQNKEYIVYAGPINYIQIKRGYK